MKISAGLESESIVIGQFTHQLNPQGKARTQGQVLGIQDGIVSIQLSNMNDNAPTVVIEVPVATLKNKSEMRYYKTFDEMKAQS